MSPAVAKVSIELHYRDPAAALHWLQQVFGLETELMVSDAAGQLVFARVSGGIGVVPEGPGRPSPSAFGGAATDTVSVDLDSDVRAHCERARAAGARIVIEPREEFYGALNYVAADLEGRNWCFSQQVSQGGPPPEGWSVRFPNRRPA